MELNKKRERMYAQFQELSENARNERDQKKADRKFSKLFKTFASEDEFNMWWREKIKANAPKYGLRLLD